MKKSLLITSMITAFFCPLTRAACNGIGGSASYCLQQATLNGGGTTSVSPTGTNFRLTASIGQESVIGVSSSPNYVLQSGFWSFYGSGLVPVLLTVQKDTTDPTDPKLNWTGNNAPYSIYRQGAGCNTVFNGFLTSQTPQNYIDTNPPAAALTCYNVLATAPGPMPPPGGELEMSPSPSGSLDPINRNPPSD